MKRHNTQHVPYYTFDNLTSSGLRHGVFTRHGGVSPAPYASLNHSTSTGDSTANVQQNRQRALAALGIANATLATVWQTHSDRVLVLDRACDVDEQADALITRTPNLALTLRFADCTPILLYAPQQRAIGIVHAGWRGTVAGIVQQTVAAMCTHYGCQAAQLKAGIGPSISAAVYAVGEDVQQAVAAAFPEPAALLLQRAGRVYFDLWAANARALREVGVQDIEIAGICTYQRVDEFFSHRAEGPHTGRFAAFMALV